MGRYQIVIDTNVIVAALRSRRGASYKVLTLLGSDLFEANISVPLLLEYEEIATRDIGETLLTTEDIGNILDYICKVANHRQIHFLWRPFLRDSEDDMILELAVTGGCDFIITFNRNHFLGVEQFGLAILTPQEFLQKLGRI